MLLPELELTFPISSRLTTARQAQAKQAVWYVYMMDPRFPCINEAVVQYQAVLALAVLIQACRVTHLHGHLESRVCKVGLHGAGIFL